MNALAPTAAAGAAALSATPVAGFSSVPTRSSFPPAARRGLSRRSLLARAATLVGLAGAACSGATLDDGVSAGSTPGGPKEASESGNGAAPLPAALPGRLLYVGDADIWVWEKGTARKLTGDRISRQPSWSPDGRRIALVKLDVSSSDIWVMDADGANSRQLTHNASRIVTQNNWAFRPIWWPDGSKLLYLSEETTNDLMLWQLSLDGRSHRPFLVVPDMEGGLDMPSFSPDGRQLALVSYRGPGLRSQVWTYTLPSGPWRQLTESAEGAYDPAWSPDGTRIAYTQRSQGRNDVWIMDADGSHPQPVTGNGASRAPCWSPDGQYLGFISAQTGGFELWVTQPPAPKEPAVVAATGSPGPLPTEAEPKVPPARQLTRGALLDAVSGLSWTR